jgi:hypothetical protein
MWGPLVLAASLPPILGHHVRLAFAQVVDNHGRGRQRRRRRSLN